MRKITKQAANAFFNKKKFSKGNTTVIYTEGYWQMLLHGNCIAALSKSRRCVYFTLAGWPTNITKERLKGLGIIIHQEKGAQYISTHHHNVLCQPRIDDYYRTYIYDIETHTVSLG